MTCPCGNHAACVPGCALMDYPGYVVDWTGEAHAATIAAQNQPMPEWLKQQRAAEQSDVFCGPEDDGFRTAYPEMPHSPPLPDVTRTTIKPLSEATKEWAEKNRHNFMADPAPVPELVQEIDDWYAANDPLMAGAGDGNSPPWTPERFVDDPHTGSSFDSLLAEEGILEEVTTTALDRILEARGERYGRFRDNADISQSLKETIHHHPMSNWETLASDQREALDQFACKISRLLVGDPDYVDNWDDIAGYAKLVAERLREEQA